MFGFHVRLTTLLSPIPQGIVAAPREGRRLNRSLAELLIAVLGHERRTYRLSLRRLHPPITAKSQSSAPLGRAASVVCLCLAVASIRAVGQNRPAPRRCAHFGPVSRTESAGHLGTQRPADQYAQVGQACVVPRSVPKRLWNQWQCPSGSRHRLSPHPSAAWEIVTAVMASAAPRTIAFNMFSSLFSCLD
jgi:hypothetical protein